MKRLIKKNQWGEPQYIGCYKQKPFEYADEMNSEAIEEIMEKLYYFEEAFEDLQYNFSVLERKAIHGN